MLFAQTAPSRLRLLRQDINPEAVVILHQPRPAMVDVVVDVAPIVAPASSFSLA
jgi:hypothetical protein